MSGPFNLRRGIVIAAAVVASTVVAAMFIAPNASTPDDDTDPWTGRWLINGLSAQDIEYSGSLTIRKAAEGYELQWLVTGDIAVGQGRISAGRLEATWRSTSAIDDEVLGTASYVIDGDGVLHGTRVINGIAGSGTEEGELAP